MYPTIHGIVPAFLVPDGGATVTLEGGVISMNGACLRMLQRMDGHTPLRALLADNGWRSDVVLPLLEHFASLGLVAFPENAAERCKRGWIKTTRIVAVSIEIIQQCNQNCKRCYLSDITSTGEQLTFSELEDLFSDLVAYGVTSVCLSGGEPLMRGDLEAVVRLARSKGLQVAIATNGTLLTRQMTSRLLDAGVRALQISVDGLDETHDATRRCPGAFAALERVFRTCAEVGLEAYAITGINEQNVDEIVALNAVLAKWGACGQLLPRYVPSGVADDDFGVVSREKLLAMLADLRCHPALPIVSCDPVVNRLLGGSGRCGAGYFGGTVTADGNVKICDTLPHFIGNVREQNIGEIFETSPLVRRLVQRHQNLDSYGPLLNDPCYGCVAFQFLAWGSVDGVDMLHPAATFRDFTCLKASSSAQFHVPYVPAVGAELERE